MGLELEKSKTVQSGVAYDINAKLIGNLRDMGVSMQFIGRDLMRTRVNNLTKFTWPLTKREGVEMIDRQISRVFVSFDDPQVIKFFHDEFGEGGVTKGGVAKGKKRRQRATEKVQQAKFNWSGDAQEMSQWHAKHRNQYGYIRKKKRYVAKRGEYRFTDQMYVPKGALKRFKTKQRKKIGVYKAGWQPAVQYFAAKTKGRAVAPAFVRAQPRKSGTFRDMFTRGGNGFATATNKVPWASRLTAWAIHKADANAEAYIQKASKKQAEKIAARFSMNNPRYTQGALGI